MLPNSQLPSRVYKCAPRLRHLVSAVASGAFLLTLFAWPLLNEFLWPPGHGQAAAQVLSETPTAFQITETATDLQPSETATATEASETPTPGLSPTPSPAATTPPAPIEAGGGHSLDGLMVLSLSEQGYAQLFSHQLLGEPFTRLTSGAWDDIHPALSPNGEKIAFSSNREGQWDIYVLDLKTGETGQLSNDPSYDGRPSWSADGNWLAYEHGDGNNLEIYMRPQDGSIDPVLISSFPSLDYAPAWRPGAQQIAFISDRSGRPQVWLVDLEKTGPERFHNIGQSGVDEQNSPAWSPDGKLLAWSAKEGEAWRIYIQDLSDAAATPISVGVGQEPHWGPSGDVILAKIPAASGSYLTAYTLDGGLALAPESLPGRFEGMAWSSGDLAALPAVLQAAAFATPSAEWAEALHVDRQLSSETLVTKPLRDLDAPYAELNELVVEPFKALRQRTIQLLGWDPFSTLENAFVPISEPLPPDRQQDWLYTGRAFSLHTSLLGAGWMAIAREDLEGQTFWHVYLSSAIAEGGLGRPMIERPWDLSARASGQESAYQAGGELAGAAPAGNWLDFTALAADYGFERLPALPSWRNYFQGALFNEFVLSGGLSWEEAMLQLYSPEELAAGAAPPTQ